MKHPQVVVYEGDGRLAQLLRQPLRACRWALREPRQRDVCLRFLRGGGPTVFVLKLGVNLEQELPLLERAQALAHGARTVVVGDLQNEPLANLAWDLGASFVLFPPMPHDWLPDIVGRLMHSIVAGTHREARVAPASGSTAPTEAAQKIPSRP
jgi:hypothetical protein